MSVGGTDPPGSPRPVLVGGIDRPVSVGGTGCPVLVGGTECTAVGGWHRTPRCWWVAPIPRAPPARSRLVGQSVGGWHRLRGKAVGGWWRTV